MCVWMDGVIFPLRGCIIKQLSAVELYDELGNVPDQLIQLEDEIRSLKRKMADMRGEVTLPQMKDNQVPSHLKTDQSTPTQPNQLDKSTPTQPNQSVKSTPTQPNQLDNSTPTQPNQLDKPIPTQPNQSIKSTPTQPNQLEKSTPSQPNQLDKSTPSQPNQSIKSTPAQHKSTPTQPNQLDKSTPSQPNQLDKSTPIPHQSSCDPVASLVVSKGRPRLAGLGRGTPYIKPTLIRHKM